MTPRKERFCKRSENGYTLSAQNILRIVTLLRSYIMTTDIRSLTLKVADTSSVSGWGFLAQLVEYAQKRGTFTLADLIRRFAGKPAPSKGGTVKKVDVARLTRYTTWCLQQGIVKPVKTPRGK